MSGLITSIKIITGIARILFWNLYADLAQFIHNTRAGHTSIWLITWSATDYMSRIKCIPWSIGVITKQLGNFTHNLKTN